MARNVQQRTVRYVHSDFLIRHADQHPALKGRASLTHELIRSYDLCRKMLTITAQPCTQKDLMAFHHGNYVSRMKAAGPLPPLEVFIQPRSMEMSIRDNTFDEDIVHFAEIHGISHSCPPWRGVFDHACAVAGSTISACRRLCQSGSLHQVEIIVNWAGGYHNAYYDNASGFCYVNDVILGILELRTYFQRVLYIDLGIHHPEPVQRYFENTRRVFTLSFHRMGRGVYPGYGRTYENGAANAQGYSINFPYKAGIDGVQFQTYFKRIAGFTLYIYRPDVVVIQCGADTLIGDPLGGTNLTAGDLIQCINFVIRMNLPTLLLGGGGYHFPNASRYWALITAHLCGIQLDEDIPMHNPCFLQYGDDYSLQLDYDTRHLHANMNTLNYLEQTAISIETNLRIYNVNAI